jgi:hypothetical protein
MSFNENRNDGHALKTNFQRFRSGFAPPPSKILPTPMLKSALLQMKDIRLLFAKKRKSPETTHGESGLAATTGSSDLEKEILLTKHPRQEPDAGCSADADSSHFENEVFTTVRPHRQSDFDNEYSSSEDSEDEHSSEDLTEDLSNSDEGSEFDPNPVSSSESDNAENGRHSLNEKNRNLRKDSVKTKNASSSKEIGKRREKRAVQKSKGKKNYVDKFTSKWLHLPEFKGWLKADEKEPSKAYCSYCSKPLKGNKSAMRRHASRPFHVNAVKAKMNQVSALSCASKELQERAKLRDSILGLELGLCAFIVKENLPVSKMDQLPDVLKNYIKDSPTVSGLACARTKSSEMIKHVIAKEGEEELATDLKGCKFSIIVDESTDVSCTKFLVILVRYAKKVENDLKVVEEFLAMPKVKDASAAGLKALIVNEFVTRGIPVANIIGFASDNASVMLGKNNGLATLLKQELPWLVVHGCICHSFALCSAAACEALDSSVIQFSHDIYNFVAFSPKRKEEFKECQAFLNIAEHAVLYPSKTRWLAMEQVVQRLLEQWPALTLYFQSMMLTEIPAANAILKGLQSHELQLYYMFLGYILPVVNRLNLQYQSEDVRIHLILKSVRDTLGEILRNFMKENSLRNKDPFEVDVFNPHNLRPFNEIYFGAKFDVLVKSENLRLSSHQVNDIQVKCVKFYQILVKQIQKRINHRDPLLKQLECIDPSIALSGQISSIAPLYSRFCATYSVDVEELNSEWRRLPFVDEIFEVKGKEGPVAFWSFVDSCKDAGKNKMFKVLPSFMFTMMSLPHSSAGAERQFSLLKLIKSPLRNRLDSEMLSALMHVHRFIPDAKKWTVPVSLLAKARKWKNSAKN